MARARRAVVADVRLPRDHVVGKISTHEFVGAGAQAEGARAHAEFGADAFGLVEIDGLRLVLRGAGLLDHAGGEGECGGGESESGDHDGAPERVYEEPGRNVQKATDG